jgi:hypothetical protein
MKTYIEHTNVIVYEGLNIPKDFDNKDYIRALSEVKNGEAEIIPATTAVLTWDDIRNKREMLLKETDWVGLNDIKAIVNKNDWIEYRQKLRDLPQAYATPEEVIWPTKPGS